MKKLINLKSAVKNKFWLFVEICLIGAIAGVIFQVLQEGTLNPRSILVGMVVGITFWVFEFVVLVRWRAAILRLPLLATIILRAFGYLLVIYFVINLLGLIFGYLDGRSWGEFFDSLKDREQLVLYGYTLALYVLLSFHVQIHYLLGEGVLIKFLLGHYRKPINEDRIFMFLDLKSSTTIAEKLGLTQYYAFLNDFFHEISQPVQATHAEIYQYVGDEIVFTWKTEEGISNNNCLSLFFKIKERVIKRRQYYLDKYGVVPEFKAGLHFGEVISAQIGDIKKEIVYNGDVLNTSARIQEQCNQVNREFLISGSLLKQLNMGGDYRQEKIQSLNLRGKENITHLFGISR